MTTRDLVSLLEEAYDGEPWHGPALHTVLEGVLARDAVAKPVAGRHSIWEIVLHATSWTREVDRRLQTGTAGPPIDGDWPAVTDTTPQAWQAALQALGQAHASLIKTVGQWPDHRWDEMLGDARNLSEGTGVSFGVMVAGLATHHAYHAGQIAILAPRD